MLALAKNSLSIARNQGVLEKVIGIHQTVIRHQSRQFKSASTVSVIANPFQILENGIQDIK